MTRENLTSRLLQSGLCSPSSLRGCTAKEIRAIETSFGRALPGEYKKLLGIMGKGAGDFISDVTMYFPAIVKLTDKSRELLREVDVDLPPDAFVFASRYGEQLLFFHVKPDDDDPPIYRWHDERPKVFKKVFTSIWAFIEEELTSHEYMLRDDDE
jgi:hypothetical protein